MEILCLLFVYLSLVCVESRLAVDSKETLNNQNEINNTNIKRAIIDDAQNEIEHKTNDDNKIDGTSNNISTKIPPGALEVLYDHLHEILAQDNGTALLLTPLLEEGNHVRARSLSKVDPQYFLGLESYSGFFTVNKTYNSNLFFWYFPALGHSVNETPWIVWLQGGPGASSMAGLFDEVGPFRMFNNSLRGNPYTWLKDHSMVFIDNPVGTGFSFTDSPDGFAKNMETYRDHLFSTINQFLQVFPELRTAPLYIAGESYAGKYVPALGLEIHKQKQAGNLDINLQGFLVGNAFIDPEVISDPSIPMMYFGLLQQEQIDVIKPLLDRFKQLIRDNNSVGAKLQWSHLIYVLLTITHQSHNYNFLRDDLALGNYMNLLKTSEIKRALHVGDIKYDMVNFTVNMELAPDFLWNSRPVFEELLEHYRVLAYCGQLDLMVPCVYSSQNQAKWNWSQSAKFRNATRQPYMFRGRLAGYHKSGGNLTEVVVRGAGHMAPQDAPAVTYDMVSKFTHGRPYTMLMSTYEGFILAKFPPNINLNNTNIDINKINSTFIYL